MGLVAAAGFLALLSACTPTKGSNPYLFVQSPTNNTDFAAPVSIPTGVQPVSVAIAPQGTVCPTADPNNMAPCPASASGALPVCPTGDPNFQAPNAAVANFIDSTVTFLTNDGKGNFTPQTIVSDLVGPAPVQIKFADLKHRYGINPGSCAFDMVVMLEQNLVSSGYGLTVLLTTDNVNWTAQQIYIGTPLAQFELIDMNNDGFLDIVASVPANNTMQIYYNLGDGTGTFNPAPVSALLADPPGRFVVRDYLGNPLLDSGGCPYMAALIPGSSQVEVAYNTGATCGTAYTYVAYLTDIDPVDINAADLSGTGLGYPALLVITQSTPRLDIFQYQPTTPPTFVELPNIGIRASATRMYTQKFDGTDPEAVIVEPSNETVETFMSIWNGGQPYFVPGVYAIRINPFDLAIGNFTTSGTLDLAVPESTNRILFIGRNAGAGNFTFTQIGFAAIPGEPAVARLRALPVLPYQDILLPFMFDNVVLYLRNNNG